VVKKLVNFQFGRWHDESSPILSRQPPAFDSMTKVAKIYGTVKKSLNFVEKSSLSSNKKPMPIANIPIIAAVEGAGVTDPPQTMETAMAIRLHAENMKGHIYGKIPLKTGETKIAAMTMLESPTKPPIQILKDLTQGKELEEKSRVQKISNPLMDPQWSISTATAKPTTNLHAAAMPHAAN
jgi:hypothetical protein